VSPIRGFAFLEGSGPRQGGALADARPARGSVARRPASVGGGRAPGRGSRPEETVTLEGTPPGHRIFRRAVVALGVLLLGFSVHGEGRVPKSGALIVAANHRRIADPVFVSMAVPRRLRWMALRELFVFPIRKLVLFGGAFPVDRENGGRAGLLTALSLLSGGAAVGVFPEGTRQETDARRGAPKSGVGMLAARTGAPILPVYVDRVPGLGARLRGGRLRVYIGEPLRPDESRRRNGAAYRQIAEETLRAIYALKEEHAALRAACSSSC
jgi:1-acyl-sn-glycerol-3-phosphate acyltransferase